MSTRGIASFVAGFGTGYLNAKNKQEEKESQDKKDKMAEEEHAYRMKSLEREDQKAQKVDALDADIAAIPKETYKTKTSMSPDDVRGMTGGSANPEDANYVSDEAAQHYAKNNTGPDQVNSNAAYFAKQGVGDGLAGKKAVAAPAGETQLANPEDGVKRAPWKILEEAAQKRIASGMPDQMQLGYGALAQAATIKSQAIKDGMQKAMAEPGDKATNLIKFASNWDNEDFQYTDMRLDKSGDPERPKLYAKVNGEGDEVLLRDYSKLNLPKGMSVADAMVLELETMIDPAKIFEQQRNAMTMKREDARNEIADKRNAIKDSQEAQLFPEQLKTAQATAVKAGIDAKYAEPKAKSDLAQNAAAIEASKSTAAKNLYEVTGGDGVGKPLTATEKSKSSEINAARRRVQNLTPDQLKFIKSGDIGMNASVSPEQKQLQEAYKTAMEPDPALVRVYGTDPHLDRFSAGQPAYKNEPLPPPQKRKEGATYEMADGTTVVWDGKGLKPKR